MVKRIKDIRDNSIYVKATSILFPILLCLFAMISFNKGINITDTGYNYTNFRFIDHLDDMWLFSTYLSNMIGAFLTHLPFGNTMAGMNFYTGLFKCALGLVSYFFFVYRLRKDKEVIFVCELMALGLCWCPTALIYNYLTYLLFALGAIWLYMGLTKERTRYLILAGIALGVNVLVRFPNLAEAALIIAVWYYGIIKKSGFGKVLRQTFLCLAGYAGAVLTLLGFLFIRYGFNRYITGIQDLFAMTGEAADYSTYGMVLGIIRAYVGTLHWFIPIIVILVGGIIINLILPDKWNLAKVFTGIVLGIGLLFIGKKIGLFNFNYHTFESVYNFGCVILVLLLLIYIIVIFHKGYSLEDKLLASIMIIMIGISPLGSNNQLYVNLNFMFLIVPPAVYFLWRLYQLKRMVPMLIIGVLCAGFWFQSIMFGATYVFRDGVTEPMNAIVTNNEVLKGMYTTRINADRMEGISQIWNSNDLDQGSVLLYDNVSSMSYYLGTKLAISTAWPDLRSFSTAKLRSEITELTDRIVSNQDMPPAVILGVGTADVIAKQEELSEKQEIIHTFMETFCYDNVYENDQFTLYLVNR